MASHYLDRVTDTNGRISISDLEPGVYSIKEIAAPSGYVLNDTEYHAELFPGKDSTIVVNNEKKAQPQNRQDRCCDRRTDLWCNFHRQQGRQQYAHHRQDRRQR